MRIALLFGISVLLIVWGVGGLVLYAKQDQGFTGSNVWFPTRWLAKDPTFAILTALVGLGSVIVGLVKVFTS